MRKVSEDKSVNVEIIVGRVRYSIPARSSGQNAKDVPSMGGTNNFNSVAVSLSSELNTRHILACCKDV